MAYGPPDPAQLEQFMAAIRRVESGSFEGNYGAIGPETDYGRATGAYQMLDSTWGGYGGYRRAADAPPHIQDERARQLMTHYYQTYGSWDLVAVAWHGGPGAANKAAKDPSYTSKISDGYNTTAQYVQKVRGYFGGGVSDPAAQADFMRGPGVAEGDTGIGQKWKTPNDGKLMRTIFGHVVLVFDLPEGVRVWYEVNDSVDVSQYGQPVPYTGFDPDKSVFGGDASELHTAATQYNGSFNAMWQERVNLFITDPEARKDAGVLKVYAEFVARPDMSPEELQAKLRQTDWWNGRTARQREWNDLSYADQLNEVAKTAAELREAYFRDTGVDISADDPELVRWAQKIAKGELGFGWVVETWIRAEARKNPESPFMRTVRNERENQRKRGIDIENQTAVLRGLANEWGVQLTDKTLAKWGQEMVEQIKSEDDFLEYLKDTAAALYPWKDRELATQQAAEPWLQRYEAILERPAHLLNPVIQKALTNGTNILDFEMELRQRPEWRDTKNARDESASLAGALGRQMGFE